MALSRPLPHLDRIVNQCEKSNGFKLSRTTIFAPYQNKSITGWTVTYFETDQVVPPMLLCPAGFFLHFNVEEPRGLLLFDLALFEKRIRKHQNANISMKACKVVPIVIAQKRPRQGRT